jgi:hypothetical protein
MAEGNFGGGGSVKWMIKSDELKSPADLSVTNSLEKGVYTERGTDFKTPYGQNFVIRLIPPRGMTAEQFIKKFSELAKPTRDGRVEFALPIEDQPRPQVWVGWGNIPTIEQNPFGRTAN